MQLRKLFIDYLGIVRICIPVFCSIATQTPVYSMRRTLTNGGGYDARRWP